MTIFSKGEGSGSRPQHLDRPEAHPRNINEITGKGEAGRQRAGSTLAILLVYWARAGQSSHIWELRRRRGGHD